MNNLKTEQNGVTGQLGWGTKPGQGELNPFPILFQEEIQLLLATT